MRKRTQLVGFEFGYWKHVQYCAEFIDNALDAIESFQWREVRKSDSKIKFSLDQELFLEKFSIIDTLKEEKKSQHLNNEAKHTLMQELGIESEDQEQIEIQEVEEKEEDSEKIANQEELEVEEEVQRIIDDMQGIIKPVENIIDVEPIVSVRIREFEAPSFLTSEISQKNIMSYTFEIFDNGTGMAKIDLRKFGRYLASSKSMELKQTRGSQGFGAPSAFSDAQNTTGKPVVTVSKSPDTIYATVAEFFTTSKNEKKYLIHPTDIDSFFLHGTYIKLNYLNVKYVKGYVEKYIEETAFMNPHVTIIYIDPDGKEKIYRRLATTFPDEPKYAKPHPSSVNIGDLQDLISKSENKSISAFLQDNFVRMSSRTAKEIVDIAERDLQDQLKLLILKDGFINLIQKKTDEINYMTYEKRVYGRSDKPRDKLIIYRVESEELKEEYWKEISEYNKLIKESEKINKEIRKLNDRIEKTETQKEIKNIEKEIRKLIKNKDEIINQKDRIKTNLNTLFTTSKEQLIELKKLKNRTESEDLVNKVLISKVKPIELTKEQFNSLFLAFKSIKYMAPPTDTAIPVGESTLENTLIKEIGLRISENVDDFAGPIENITQTSELIHKEKQKTIQDEGVKTDSDVISSISIDPQEIIDLNSEILGTIDIIDDLSDQQKLKTTINELVSYSDIESIDSYNSVFEYFIENFTKDDDFVAGETRAPTSGKGLAYVVEAVMAYSRNLEVPKRSRDVLSRFVNRTPKLRDSADCAITKAVQSVNWKNYNLDTYDNSLPKGPIKLLVNVSGPFVHLMFKSQSKNALADDEDLIKEIKYCLEAIGRRLRIYLNRKASLRKKEKRANLIEKYIPLFVNSLYNIASQGESVHKSKLNKKELEDLMRNAIGKKAPPIIKPEEVPKIKDVVIEKKEILEEPKDLQPVAKKVEPIKEIFTEKTLKNWTKNELVEYCKENSISLLTKDTKTVIINKILDSYKKPHEVKPELIKPPEPEKITPEPIPVKQTQLPISKVQAPSKIPPKKTTPITKPKSVKQTQTTLPIITTEKILKVLSDKWQTISHLILKLKIKDMMDARYLQHQLKKLEREDKVLVESKMGKRQWKLKT
ncbi:MAG: DNA topoisomerase VI subunit B [Candidatus Lokiarchaeia archaeon]|nr:DNA topoisomerase VI subunit B [Candidatus Lokiarchaeia archaeon]